MRENYEFASMLVRRGIVWEKLFVTKWLFCLITGFGLHVVCPVYADGSTPSEALRQMKPAPGFTVKQVGSEPEIRQPLSISFDDCGRMWVIQYLQYPTPAGLKPV